jgi:amino acid transporter
MTPRLTRDDLVLLSDTVLAKMARVWGDWAFGEEAAMAQMLADWMSIDAFIVLSGNVAQVCRGYNYSVISCQRLEAHSCRPSPHAGAVLTAYVGVDGLVYQMAADRCLPSFLLRKNHWRGTNHYIILSFFILCVSQVCSIKDFGFVKSG